MVEQRAVNPWVVGSSPTGGATTKLATEPPTKISSFFTFSKKQIRKVYLGHFGSILIVFSAIQVISTAMAVASAQSAGIVVAHITTIQKPFLSVKQYAGGLFGALLCFSFSFASAGYVLSVVLLTWT